MDKSGHVRANSPGKTESRRALAGGALGGRDRRKRPWDTATWWNKSPAAPSGLGKHTQGHLCLPGLAEHGCPPRCPHSMGAVPRPWQWSGNTHIPTGGPGPPGLDLAEVGHGPSGLSADDRELGGAEPRELASWRWEHAKQCSSRLHPQLPTGCRSLQSTPPFLPPFLPWASFAAPSQALGSSHEKGTGQSLGSSWPKESLPCDKCNTWAGLWGRTGGHGVRRVEKAEAGIREMGRDFPGGQRRF